MGAAIPLRREPLTALEQERVWQSLCDDTSLADIAYKIETDAWGAVRMRPTQARHARIVGRIIRLLQAKLGSEAMPELAILTTDGIKVPDIGWCSAEFLATKWADSVLRHAPEICVEVVSPSNTEAEMHAKIGLYLEAGAVEVWLIAENGLAEVHTRTGRREDSIYGFSPAAELN